MKSLFIRDLGSFKMDLHEHIDADWAMTDRDFTTTIIHAVTSSGVRCNALQIANTLTELMLANKRSRAHVFVDNAFEDQEWRAWPKLLGLTILVGLSIMWRI